MKVTATVFATALGSAILLANAGVIASADAHEASAYSAGEPGNPKKPARTVKIIMREGPGQMLYEPDRLEVKRGEQIRFIVTNEGELPHEFLLASTADNLKHAELMKKYPDMEHDDPNG